MHFMPVWKSMTPWCGEHGKGKEGLLVDEAMKPMRWNIIIMILIRSQSLLRGRFLI